MSNKIQKYLLGIHAIFISNSVPVQIKVEICDKLVYRTQILYTDQYQSSLLLNLFQNY